MFTKSGLNNIKRFRKFDFASNFLFFEENALSLMYNFPPPHTKPFRGHFTDHFDLFFKNGISGPIWSYVVRSCLSSDFLLPIQIMKNFAAYIPGNTSSSICLKEIL